MGRELPFPPFEKGGLGGISKPHHPPINLLYHERRIPQHPYVIEPQYLQPKTFELRVPCCILAGVLPFPMLRTVDFDDPFCAQHIEIDEVGTDGFLAVERDIGLFCLRRMGDHRRCLASVCPVRRSRARCFRFLP